MDGEQAHVIARTTQNTKKSTVHRYACPHSHINTQNVILDDTLINQPIISLWPWLQQETKLWLKQPKQSHFMLPSAVPWLDLQKHHHMMTSLV